MPLITLLRLQFVMPANNKTDNNMLTNDVFIPILPSIDYRTIKDTIFILFHQLYLLRFGWEEGHKDVF